MSASLEQAETDGLSMTGDDDSDLDLDLTELDSGARATSPVRYGDSARQKRHGGRPAPGAKGDGGARIPLKTLDAATGSRSRARKGRGALSDALSPGYGKIHGEEESRSLLGDDDDAGRESRELGAKQAGDPRLLGGSSAGPGAVQRSQGRWAGSAGPFLDWMFRSGDARRTALSGDDADLLGGSRAATGGRTIWVGGLQKAKYPPNAVSNAKYTPWSFLPITLYNEFSFFLNLYFLLVALSQIIPSLRIGYLSTYVAPLVFVLTVTLGKEAFDDIGRRRRDAEANAETYIVLQPNRQRYRDSYGDGEHLQQEQEGLHSQAQAPRGKLQKSNGKERSRGRIKPGHVQMPAAGLQPWEKLKKSRDLQVGDILRLGKDQRVPTDVVLLGSYPNNQHVSGKDSIHEGIATLPEGSGPPGDRSVADADIDRVNEPEAEHLLDDTLGAGETFIRTDQLDGETDWKLRLASPLTQSLDLHDLTNVEIIAGRPEKSINEFVGAIHVNLPTESVFLPSNMSMNGESRKPRTDSDPSQKAERLSAPLTVDNTAWANTVIASNSTTLAVVVYTGLQTRQAMSTSRSRSKTGLLEYEINSLTKILCLVTLALSVTLVALEAVEHTEHRKWYIAVLRFLILFSSIIPISLRVNLDMGKTVYSRFIERDEGIKGTVVRTSTIPEELGRIEYLLTDKTGTLTQNDMELKKIHVGTVSYANEAMDEVASYVHQAFREPNAEMSTATAAIPANASVSAFAAPLPTTSANRTRREIGSRVCDVVLALALCHNVTPTTEEKDGERMTTYQGSSPDEIAILRWTESVGLRLSHRDRRLMILECTDPAHEVLRARILDVFPFTSEGKRMGLIAELVRKSNGDSASSSEIWFFQKGADTVMATIVAANDWLEEETGNMAREGLRTLVIGRKRLSARRYQDFAADYKQASLALLERDRAMATVVEEYLERDLELLGVTGVEDKLQDDVKPSLELLRNAGIKIWMLTGDKVETARCVAISARLVARGQYIHTITKVKQASAARDALDFLRAKTDSSLLIDGESLAMLLSEEYRRAFISLAVLLPTVIACRCSPTQKAEVAQLIRAHTQKRVCCIGDGGNDVSMIQAADVGVGIVGKEGRQASLAADFSILQFCYLPKLLVWHGRNSYKRSAKLAQFVIHRGLIISVCQTMFSIASKFEPIALYKNWLWVGYATVYTMSPVFSLVLDRDVDERLAKLYPELYKELTEGRSLSYRSFFVWVLVSVYQGSMIQALSQLLVDVHGARMVATSFTVLVINELVMVAFEVTTWHPVMILALLGTALLYFASIPLLGEYFDLRYVVSWAFVWRVLAISAVSLVPPYVLKIARRTWKPPSYRKVRGV
ncbi:MAG: putative aminophospholipid-translocase [Phylliscum demangeonii]|nr:MAG: putative aminophospholipid-translocase [Phylliscum demangeonii]